VQVPDVPADTSAPSVVVLDEACVRTGSPARLLTGRAAAAFLADADAAAAVVEQPVAAEMA
jgi:hypothetical protein